MSKRKHHFVPLFYLRAFQSQRRRIHLYHLKSKRQFSDAALKDQCYRLRLHGSDDEIENRLAQLEGLVAPAVKRVIDKSELPSANNVDQTCLYAFVAIQLVRVPKHAEQFSLLIDKAMKQAYSGAASEEGYRYRSRKNWTH